LKRQYKLNKKYPIQGGILMKSSLVQITAKILMICTLALGSIGGAHADSSHVSSAPKPLFTQINFNTYMPTPFGSQDVNPVMTIEDNGNTLHLKGNSWKKISLPYTVTPNTVLEFDFKSPAQGEVHGIGFDNDEKMSDGYTHKLYGTQGWGLTNSFYRYDPSAQEEWRHYRIPIGDHYTGNMLYLVFVNDHDISNPTAESYFGNVQVFEDDPNTPLSPPILVDYNNYIISPYSGFNQSPALTMTIEESGTAMRMVGNGWLKMSFPYLVTESTVIEFDFKSASQGNIHGIGFDDNNSYQQDRTFSLHGTQAWGMNAFRYSLYAPEWKHYRIPVGKYYTGMMRYIFFTNDHDVSSPTAESYFKNLTIYEGEVSLPLTVDFNQYAFSPYYSSAGSNASTISVLDNGNTLHLSGNGWTQISMPITILPETVIEFDFKSTAQGEVHGLGFDTDQSSDSINTFKLYGTQNYGNAAFNDYAGSAPEWKHYVIPIGQYITSGQRLYLFFANDHDVTDPTAESYFSNVQIYSPSPEPTPTPTAIISTPTNTPTITLTATATLTVTPTATSIPTTPAPNSFGFGTCWASENSWEGFTVSYSIDRDTIPVSLGWDASIFAAAQTWNNVSPSHFELVFYPNEGSNNVISYQVPPNPEFLAQVYPYYFNPFVYITEKKLDINPYFDWDTNNVPDNNDPDTNGTSYFNVQNIVTHELGHFLQLEDMFTESCSSVTMYRYVNPGEIKKITLDVADMEAINWQYP
jgi:hypothetical protein